jgi:hypothetical protein
LAVPELSGKSIPVSPSTGGKRKTSHGKVIPCILFTYLSGQIPSRRKNPKEELDEMRKDKDKETNAQNVQLPIVGGLLFLLV